MAPNNLTNSSIKSEIAGAFDSFRISFGNCAQENITVAIAAVRHGRPEVQKPNHNP